MRQLTLIRSYGLLEEAEFLQFSDETRVAVESLLEYHLALQQRRRSRDGG
jgi:hypothetical protein